MYIKEAVRDTLQSCPPPLPSGAENADDAIRNSRYMQLQGKAFYRGLADPDDATSALLFTSNEKLELLKESSHVYFNATFKVVPRLYYQLFTVFVPYADAAFPVLYALMTRKTHAAYLALFQNLKELVPYLCQMAVRCVIHLLTWLCVCISDVYLANYRKTLLELN